MPASKTESRIPFNRPTVVGTERDYLDRVFQRGKFAGVGPFGKRCNEWLTRCFGAPAVLTTSSGTHALEMAALLCELQPGDEVILPSFAFPTTASSFARCGARLVFVDIEPSTMNIDPEAVAAAVTPRTRALIALHYAGVACDMDRLLAIADRHGLLVVEDAAQAILSRYHDRHCGTLGHLGCLSFHETKNLQCGEGGALIINDKRLVQRAEVLLEKGTDRSRFFRGEVDKYSWLDCGSSYVLGELGAAFLLAQLEHGDEITSDRLGSWRRYQELLQPLRDAGLIELPNIPTECRHNGHIFWLKLASGQHRDQLIASLASRSIHSVFHYVPLHSAPAGRRYGCFHGEDRFTSDHAERLLRLPLFYRFTGSERVAAAVAAFLEHLRG